MGALVKENLKRYYGLERNVNSVVIKIDLDDAIDHLSKRGIFDSTDLEIIELVKQGASTTEISDEISLYRTSIGDRIRKICDAMEGYLGEEYSDSRILGQVRLRLGRSLSEDETKFCWYILRNFDKELNSKLSIYNFVIDSFGKVKPNA